MTTSPPTDPACEGLPESPRSPDTLLGGSPLATPQVSGGELVRELCRRLSCETGWPVRYINETAADRCNAPRHGRLPALWQCDLRDGHQRSGWLRIDQPHGRPRDASFLRACRLAEAMVPTLSLVLAEPCTGDDLPQTPRHDPDGESLHRTLVATLDILLRLTGLRSAGFFLRDEEGESLVLQADVHRDGQTIPTPRRAIADSPFDAAALRGSRSLVRRETADLPAEFWEIGDRWLPESCLLGICHPVATNEGDLLGTMWAFDRRARRLARRELQIVESVAARLAQILERAVLHKESADRQRLTDDLLAASGNTPDDVGHFLLDDGRLEIATRCHAHSSVGGDLCEVLVDGPAGSEQVVLGLGDASGHSLPATMVMATVRGALRALALDETMRIESDAIMRRLNNALVGVAQSHQFMTMVAGHLDVAAGQLTFTNAGHPPPIVLRGREIETPPSHGMLLGVFNDAEYERQTIALQPGDVLALYTDGLAEAAGPSRSMFRTEGVAASVLARRDASAVEIRDGLWNDVDRHLDGLPCDDDRSLLILKRHE